MAEFNAVNMDNILSATFGESGGTIRATFKKTINIKQYETEVVELSSTLEVPKELTGIERMLVNAVLQAQLEYEAYISLRTKGYITDAQLHSRRAELEQSVNLLKAKGEVLLGRPLNNIFNLVKEHE